MYVCRKRFRAPWDKEGKRKVRTMMWFYFILMLFNLFFFIPFVMAIKAPAFFIVLYVVIIPVCSFIAPLLFLIGIIFI